VALPAYALLKSHKDAEGAKDAERRGAKRRGPEAQRTRVTIDELSYQIIGAAMVEHTDLGPGLNEKTYDVCFADQLTTLGLQFKHQVRVPIVRNGRTLTSTFRLDYVVETAVIIEIKAVHGIHPVTSLNCVPT